MAVDKTLEHPIAGSSVSDILTALKNLVSALNGSSTTFVNVQGATLATNISAPTVLKKSAGRIASIAVLQVGSTLGVAYDGSQINSTTRPIFLMPNSLGLFEANMPASIGILIIPGNGQIVSVSYS